MLIWGKVRHELNQFLVYFMHSAIEDTYRRTTVSGEVFTVFVDVKVPLSSFVSRLSTLELEKGRRVRESRKPLEQCQQPTQALFDLRPSGQK